VRHLKKKGSDGWTVDAEELKREYTKKFNIRKLSRRNFYCFFCRRGTLASGTNDGNVKCDYCPAKIMDRRFDCCSDTYNYEHEPVKFYNKIVSLYKKFKKQRRKEKI
jgi:transcription elongation factor Elf1